MSKHTSYPSAYSATGRYYSTGGNFYHLTERHGIWKQVECYLPSATGTYGEPFEDTMNKFLARLEDGAMATKGSIEGKGAKLIITDGVVKRYVACL